MSNILESRQEPIPGYRLIERLGRGGYGDVWKVEAPGGFLKAMKFVFGNVGEEAAAEQELDALHQLVQIRHPFILSVERCDVVDAQVLITMELADRSLEDRFQECRSEGLEGIPRDELLRYMAEAAEALDLLSQEYSLQHLDIKPTNLFLVRKHVKVGDFGLVRRLEGFESPIRTGLTPLYAPPESYEGRISLNSDQYSLALVYHEMLTGRRAIDGVSGRELMYRALVEGPDLTAVRDGERAALSRALAKRPEDRFRTCGEFIEALRAVKVALVTPPAAAFDDASERDQFEQIRPKSVSLTKDELEAALRASRRRSKRANAGDLAKAPRAETSPDGTLQPTLVISLGGFGVRMGEQVRTSLHEHFGEAAAKLPVHVLHIDVDPDAVRRTERHDPGSPHEPPFVICRLRKAAEYRVGWDNSKHLSSWLEQEEIFRIGPTGETRGRRSLGRLALLDNYERVAQQILSSIAALISVETAEDARHATGLRYRRSSPTVLVAAGMGGGAGAGMAVDVAYLVRAILERAGFSAANLNLVLAAGVDSTRDRDLQIANQFGLANDLASFGVPESEYALPLRVDELPESLHGPPAARTFFFDAEAEHLPQPRERAVLESFAEFVVQVATGGHDTFAVDAGAAAEPFVSVGWFTLEHPHHRILRAAGCEFAVRVVERWLRPLADHDLEIRRGFAREFFETKGYEPAKVAEVLKLEASQQAGEPLHVRAAFRVNELIEAIDARDGKRNPQPLVYAARSDLRSMLGGDPVDDDEVRETATPYDVAFRKAAVIVAERLFEPIRVELESAVDSIERRFEVVRGVWTAFSDTLAGFIKRLVESPKNVELEREHYEAAYQLHKLLVLGAQPRHYVAAVERWVKAKLDYNGRQQLVGVYQILKSKIDELAVQVFTAPRKLEAARQRLLSMRQEALTSRPSLVRQTIYAGGAVASEEAVERLRQEKTDDDLDRLEETMRADIFTPAGGLWKTCAREDIPGEVLGDSMAASAAAWLLQQSRIQDAADAYLQRNRESPERLRRELKSFQDWSAPTFMSKANAGKRVTESLTLLLPGTAAGQELASVVLEVAEGRDIRFAAHPGTEVHFVQTASSASLGRLAPAWVLRGKPQFESPKHRGSAVVFPQMVDA